MVSEFVTASSAKEAAAAAASLAPGFRFHPTDEELVQYYLRRKICNKPFRFDAISEIDIYKVEPWDLPGKSRLKTRDLEWYFFSVLDKKYGNSSRTNRATDRGYWKTTGKDRAVYNRTKIVGMKKTLVYHNGRAPRGERTNWVMHEYRLHDEGMEKAGIVQDSFVLCRIFQKSGSGPKNGEKYGAPFIEEEWEDDDYLAIVPRNEYEEQLPSSDDACPDDFLDENDLKLILSAVDNDDPLPLNFAVGDESNNVEESRNFTDDAQEPLVAVEEINYVQEQPDGRTLFNLPVQYDMDAKSVKQEYIGEPSYGKESSIAENPLNVDYLLDEPFLDAMDTPPIGDGAFIETNDLKQPVDMDPSSFDMLDEYLQFYDATDDNFHNLGFGYSNMMGSAELHSDPASMFPYKDINEGFKQSEGQQQFEGRSDDVLSSSKQAQAICGSDYQYPFFKQATQMLGNIPAPPAFASEFPTKDAILQLNSASASSIHFTSGMVQIRDVNFSGSGMDWSYGKHGRADIILSFGLSRGDEYSADMQPAPSILSEKINTALSRGWFYFMFVWVLFFAMSFKIGSYIYAN